PVPTDDGDPSPTGTPGDGESPDPDPTDTDPTDGGPRDGDTDDDGPGEEPTLTSAPTAALVALGLVTSGAIPATLAVRRRMAGRHRRTR
ncbi:serine/threonine protein kinase, partial [Nonomuraea terrae]